MDEKQNPLLKKQRDAFCEAQNDEKLVADFLRSFEPKNCPYCGGDYVKDGKRKTGVQRYKCLRCGKKFTSFTNTIFEAGKASIDDWALFLTCLFENRLSEWIQQEKSETTIRYWLAKIFAVLDGVQDDVFLCGKVVRIGIQRIKWRKTSGGKKTPLREERQYMIYGSDEVNHFYIAAGKTTLGKIRLAKILKKHLSKGSLIVCDSDGKYPFLSLTLKEFGYRVQKNDGENCESKDRAWINQVFNQVGPLALNLSMQKYASFQDWANLLWFLSNSSQKVQEKIKQFIERAMTRKISLKYREVFKIA